MAIKLGEKKRPDPIIKNLTIPVSQRMLDLYKLYQHEFDKREEKSLHEYARERLQALLNEVGEALDMKKSS